LSFYFSLSCFGRDWDSCDICCFSGSSRNGSFSERDRDSCSGRDESRDVSRFFSDNCLSFDDERGNGRGADELVVDSALLSFVFACSNCGCGCASLSLGIIKYL